jgi:hypothetical protein
MTFANNQARFHRVRAERFRVHAYTSRNSDSRAMYLRLAARETAIAERLEAATANGTSPASHFR